MDDIKKYDGIVGSLAFWKGTGMIDGQIKPADPFSKSVPIEIKAYDIIVKDIEDRKKLKEKAQKILSLYAENFAYFKKMKKDYRIKSLVIFPASILFMMFLCCCGIGLNFWLIQFDSFSYIRLVCFIFTFIYVTFLMFRINDLYEANKQWKKLISCTGELLPIQLEILSIFLYWDHIFDTFDKAKTKFRGGCDGQKTCNNSQGSRDQANT